MNLRNLIIEINDEIILLPEEFDSALVGYTDNLNREHVAVYDSKKCIEILIETQNFSYQDAYEYFEFNILNNHLGTFTPLFITFPIIE